MTGVRFTHYDWPGGREGVLRFGPDEGPTVIAALPLFEEANRTRAAMVDVLRQLAARGIASALPDLPGMGDSLVATEHATLANWRVAFAAAVRTLPKPVHVMAWRGGALVDTAAEVASRWYLAPVTGADTMRELRRVQAASGGDDLFAGNRLSPELIAELGAATFRSPAGQTRTLRLETDPRAADAKIPGRPLWRAAEPGTDPALQTAIIDDIAAWITPCAR